MDGQVLKERLSKLTPLTQMELAEKLVSCTGRPFGGQLRVQETLFVYGFVNIVYHIVYQKAKPAGMTYWLNALHIFTAYLTAIMSTVQPNAFAIACRVSKPTE